MKKKLMLACVVMLIGVFLVGGMALAASFRGSDGPDEVTGQDATRGRADGRFGHRALTRSRSYDGCVRRARPRHPKMIGR